MRTFFLSAVVGILVLFSASCNRGPKLVSAGGTVTYQGKPLPGADVVFVPDASGMPSIGRTNDQGKFTLSTTGLAGAPPGTHKVAVTAVRQKRPVSEAEAVGMTSEQIAANHESVIPIKYNNLITSGLSATVSEDASANDYKFDLQ